MIDTVKIWRAGLVSSMLMFAGGCAVVDAQDSCRARGGTWSEYDAIGQKIWPGRCVGASESHKAYCQRLKDAIRDGSYQKLPSYCK